MNNKLKPCPYRVHGEKISSLTVEGERYYNEYFMPCMREACACFFVTAEGEARCTRNYYGTYFVLSEQELGGDSE